MRKSIIMIALMSIALAANHSAPARSTCSYEKKEQSVVAPLQATCPFTYEYQALPAAEVTVISLETPMVSDGIAVIAPASQTTSKAEGFAIRRRSALINVIILSTSGHKLINLHVDPGLTA